MAVYAPYTVPISPASKNGADEIYYGVMGAVADPVFATTLETIISTGIVTALTTPSVIAANKSAQVQALTDAAVIAAQTLATKNALTDPAVIAAAKQSIIDALTNASVITALETVVCEGIKCALNNAGVINSLATAAAQGLETALQDPATDAALIDVVEQGIYNAIDALVAAGIVKFLGEREAALMSLANAARKDAVFLQANDAENLANLKDRVGILVTDVLTP